MCCELWHTCPGCDRGWVHKQEMPPKHGPSYRNGYSDPVQRWAGIPGPWREQARRLPVWSGDTSEVPIRQSWKPAGTCTNVCTQMQMQGQSRHLLATTKPMANRQRGYQTGHKPPGSLFIIHPRLGISSDLFPCSLQIPLNCHSYPSNAANCLKWDAWVIKTSKKVLDKRLYLWSGSYQILNGMWAPSVQLMTLTDKSHQAKSRYLTARKYERI